MGIDCASRGASQLPLSSDKEHSTKTKMIQIPTLKECEKALGERAPQWAKRCYEIAHKIVKKGLVPGGEAVYGHWLGPVHPNSPFAGKRMPFVQHGWIWIEDHGLVVDPTRWCFEAKRPYLYVEYEWDANAAPCKHCLMQFREHDDLGANDECDLYEPELWPYDEGGNQWRAAMQIRKPPPKAKSGVALLRMPLKKEAAHFVGALLGQPSGQQLTKDQIFWLANLPYDALLPGGIKEIYDAICAAGDAIGERYFIEFIPIDNRNKARREVGFTKK